MSRSDPAVFARLEQPQDYQAPWVSPNNARAYWDRVYFPVMFVYRTTGETGSHGWEMHCVHKSTSAREVTCSSGLQWHRREDDHQHMVPQNIKAKLMSSKDDS